MPRILACRACKTADVIPLFESDVADPQERARLDVHLSDAVERHLRQFGNDPDRHPAVVLAIADEEYELLDSSRLKKALFDDSLEEYIRGEREQLKEDALKCYNLHNRPTYGIGYGPGCPDYKSEQKVLIRKKGTPLAEQTSLCDYCPYGSYVEYYKNKKRNFLV